MESLEISARTVDEAVELALRELGVARDEIEVVVLQKGKTGFLGLGTEEARVLVRKLPAADEQPSAVEAEEIPRDEPLPVVEAEELLRKLLSLMKVSADVSGGESSASRGVGGQAAVTLQITGEDLGILIGRRGQTLSSLQYLLYLMVSHQMKARVPIVIDVERYRERRMESLRRLALHMAEQVSATGQSAVLEPMPPGERRIIHLALQDYPGVATQSIGQGDGRKVTILSRK